jgi:sorbitol-specific phosphotransferase system component IIBC
VSQISVKIATDEDIKIETKNDIVTDEFIITPLDTCKDIVVNGITYKNVVLRHINTKDNSLYKKDIKVSKIEDKQQTTKVKENKKVKNIEKTSNPIGYILIIIIIYLVWQNRRWFLPV